MNFFENMDKAQKRKLKKRIRNIIVVAIIVLVIGILLSNNGSNKQTATKINIEELKRRTITNSISSTGTIKAEDSKSVTSSSVGLKVKTINVKEGDEVVKGDLICTFDTTEIERRLREAEASLKQTKSDIDKAVSNANQDEQIETMQKQVDNAKASADEANKSLEIAKQEKSTAEKELNDYQKTYDEAKEKYDEVKNETQEKTKAVEIAQNAYDAEDLKSEAEKDAAKILDLQTKLQKAKSELATSKNELIKAETEFRPIETKYDSLKTKLDNANAKLEAALTAADSAKATYENLNTTLQNLKKANSNNSISNSNIVASSTAVQQAQIDSLKDQINNARVTSPANGTVTSINVKEGDTYLGSVIAKVEGVQSFIVEAEIAEYDIPDIKVGQQVKIKTDATREVELEGEVIYVATVATENSSAIGDLTGLSTGSLVGGSKGATFKIQVAINTENDRLRIGMTSRINIVTENKENVWAVPYDAIQEKEDGTKYVEILLEEDVKDKKHEDLKKQEIVITTGVEGNYYQEINSDELKEGMKIVIPEREANSSLQQIIESMGAGAGI